jgi:hypothetical protein
VDGKMTGERKHKVRGGKDLTPEERQVRKEERVISILVL